MSYIIFVPLSIVIVAIIFVKHLFTYWDRQGIVNVRPKFIYGNLRPTVKHQQSFPRNINDLYWEAVTVPYIGIYLLCRPALLIRDLALIKRILGQDENSFKTRGIYCDQQRDPLSVNLFSTSDATHNNLHAKLRPLFTSAATQNLFETVHREGRHLINELGKYANDVEPVVVVNLHKLLHTYIMNVMGGTFLGMDINLFERDDEAFEHLAGNMSRFKRAQAFLYPGTMKLTKGTYFSGKTQSFLLETVENATKRGGDGIIHALIQSEAREPETSLSNTAIAAQLFSFYSAGAQTLPQTAVSCLTELLTNADTLDKLRSEIDATLKKHDDVLSYDALQEMSYLDLCLKETLRKSPPTAFLSRECTQDYLIEETGQTIKKGIKIIIPVAAIHNDHIHFKQPQKFMPERFLPENSRFITKDAYLPYGDGARQCPAIKMAEMIVKCSVVKVLSTFTLVPGENNNEAIINKHPTNETLLKNVIIKPRTEINNN